MEAALLKISRDRSFENLPQLGNTSSKPKSSWRTKSTEDAHRDFVKALHDILPHFLQQQQQQQNEENERHDKSKPSPSSSNNININETATWLYNLTTTIPSPLSPLSLSTAVLSACLSSKDESQIQGLLFDTLGEGERAMEVLFEIVPRVGEIRDGVTEEDLVKIDRGDDVHDSSSNNNNVASVVMDPEEERLTLLRLSAYEAMDYAALLKSRTSSNSLSSGNTHNVGRSSDKAQVKAAKKAARAAAVALAAAKEAGAIMGDEDDGLLNGGGGGLKREILDAEAMGMSAAEYERMSKFDPQLGSVREHGEKKTLPEGTIREVCEGYEMVIIPAPDLKRANLHPRLQLTEIMNGTERRAFSGTDSLNPMQSAVFEAAFHTKENLLICAPTGAGKTNVAMTSVVAHLKDKGMIQNDDDPYAAYTHVRNDDDPNPENNNDASQVGRKIVYVAPMKALAQEVVEKFSSKLKPLKIVVREFTGDMQLTRAEADRADILVTTPEKWDVVTRKGGDGSLGRTCGLLIIDEVHLLADGRGAVIESVVARLHRLVETSQRNVRIVGLSATLPNYRDVATFLRVNHERGLFYFGPEHRPVPLQQQFVGITSLKNRFEREKKMNEICYDVVTDSLRRGYQVMVFVHSRRGTGDTATALKEIAGRRNELEKYFLTAGTEENGVAYGRYAEKAKKSRNREVAEHFDNGMGIHHAGMLRGDRKLTEQMFADGAIKVLCCTATLAWGINLPAHTVVVKGTEVFNPEKGGIVDLSILDVMQIFGRAGRPQYDTSGEATLITTYDAFKRYLDKLVREVPIESNFIKQLDDHLNAEIAGGTVATIEEAIDWLQYTYLHVRMLKNPLVYGINADQRDADPMLRGRTKDLITRSAKLLDENRMIRYDVESGNLSSIDLGRVASQYYIQAESVATFNEMLAMKPDPTDAELMDIICHALEFENVKVRPDEMEEVDELMNECPLEVISPVEDFTGKCCVLMQAYISKARIRSFTLISDTNYIASNCGRVARALFEMCLKGCNAGAAVKLLRLAKSIDSRIWWFQTPLRQFEGEIPGNIFKAVETGKYAHSDPFDTALSMLDMSSSEVGQLCHSKKHGSKVQRLVEFLPCVEMTVNVRPVTKGILRFQVEIYPTFEWSGRWHGGAQGFWLWVEDSNNRRIYHHEHILFNRRTHPEPLSLELIIPAFDPLPSQYYMRAISDHFVGSEVMIPVSFKHLLLPSHEMPYTDLINLTPQPISTLQNPKFEQLYTKFPTFNPIQTQLFHVLYHTDSPVLLGAPTGSGKTIVAEIALLRMKKMNPSAKCVYIAPLKSLARERLKEWKGRLGKSPLNWKVLELSGDTHHDSRVLKNADVLVCTPEKWDLISRGWQPDTKTPPNKQSEQKGREFVKDVRLLVIDEIHLLGEERGSVLEAIVSRTRFISKIVEAETAASSKKGQGKPGPKKHEIIRIVGLSTALANPNDLADWIGIDVNGNNVNSKVGMYNFRPSVRPVPMDIHLQGFAGQHYCPRMATMNKPCYAAIKEHSPKKPVIIFVSSRRQTRLTALDLISYAANDLRTFLGCSPNEAEVVAKTLKDESLRHTITFGIGLHHAGLSSSDREVVEQMFLNGDIQVLVATATLAWGVNLPAYLVIVKGTEYFDGKSSRYVDYPVTDILQMMGRAGRPQFDKHAVACVMVEQSKKEFYKKFLFQPFPVESCFRMRLENNLNAEIAIGTIKSVDDCVGYLDWTFFSRRVKLNPSYYGAKSADEKDIATFFYEIVSNCIDSLKENSCITLSDDGNSISPTSLGVSSSKFYLDYRTPFQMRQSLDLTQRIITSTTVKEAKKGAPREGESSSKNFNTFSFESDLEMGGVASIFIGLAGTHEFDELPVRHNEEKLNMSLSESLPWGPNGEIAIDRKFIKKNDDLSYDDIMLDPHTKCFLLIQAFITSSQLPISDYINDTKSVMDQIPRLLAAMEFIAIDSMKGPASFNLLTLFPIVRQLIGNRIMVGSNSLQNIPGLPRDGMGKLQSAGINSIAKLLSDSRQKKVEIVKLLKKIYGANNKVEKAFLYLNSIPQVMVKKNNISCTTEKTTGNSVGLITLELGLEVMVDLSSHGNSRGEGRKKNHKRNSKGRQDYRFIILLGTKSENFLLARAQVILSPHNHENVPNKNTRTVLMEFDWKVALSFGGDEEKLVCLRILSEDFRGVDLQGYIAMN